MYPTIFIGMHRSGTTLLGDLLSQLGLFIGMKTDKNREALFFQRLNEWVMWQVGATWDNPRAVRYLSDDPKTMEFIADYLRVRCASLSTWEYLGCQRFFRSRSLIEGLETSWGWKDPRNTFTLPLWLNIFPDARVVYIERHGVDVAKSLVTRRSARLLQAERAYHRRRSTYFLRPMKRRFSHSFRCATLEGAFSLWEDYVTEGRKHLERLGDTRCIGLQYEDLLKSPIHEVKRVSDFIGLKTTDIELTNVCRSIRSERAYAYRQDPELIAFAKQRTKQLKKYEMT